MAKSQKAEGRVQNSQNSEFRVGGAEVRSASAPVVAPIAIFGEVKLTGYRHGRIEVDGVEERRDLIVTPEVVFREWWRREGHLLHLDDLGAVLADPRDILVVGTGSMGVMRCEPGLANALADRGITLEAMRTAKAVERFNELVEKGADVAAALHLTC